MKKFELLINIGLLLSILYVAPGLIMNGQKVSIDSLEYWFGGNQVISETTKIQSIEELANQPVSATQNAETMKAIFDGP
ncbi:MAG: hypothetical protein PHH70_05660 [Candidatus Gracilibacteria bacterium]|nr:hypothetical protein [Candidatus Gracilibacteria bacterium]